MRQSLEVLLGRLASTPQGPLAPPRGGEGDTHCSSPTEATENCSQAWSSPWVLLVFVFNMALIIFNWTSEPHSRLFLRERLLQGSNYRIITLMKDNNSEGTGNFIKLHPDVTVEGRPFLSSPCSLLGWPCWPVCATDGWFSAAPSPPV